MLDKNVKNEGEEARHIIWGVSISKESAMLAAAVAYGLTYALSRVALVK